MASQTKQGDNSALLEMPNKDGRFGIYGGRYVSEILIAALDQLRSEYARLKNDPTFIAE